MKPILFCCLIYFLIPSGVTSVYSEDQSTSNINAASDAASLDSLIRQLLHTNRQLTKQLKEQQELLQNQIKENDDKSKNFEEVIKSLEEKYNQLKSDFETKMTNLNNGNEELKKEVQSIQNSHNNEILFLQQQIDRLKEKNTLDFEEVEFDGITFIKIPAGSFTMGTGDAVKYKLESLGWWKSLYQCEQPARQVTISKPFFISKYEITQGQWKRLFDDPSIFDGDNRPVENVNWYDTFRFTDALSKKWDTTYRLPTEAEWEYCARTGSDGIFGYGNDSMPITPDNITQYAWLNENSERKTQPVGKKLPNAWGLYDMYGNVWEWCNDHYLCEAYQTLPDKDPRYRGEVTESVFRGGCWDLEAQHARSSFRSGNLKEHKASYIGFRIVRETRF